MSGQLQFFIIMSIIAVDIVGNWFYIEILKKYPSHPLLFSIRLAIIIYIMRNPEPLDWLAVSTNVLWALKVINAGFLYLFVFDTGLNVARKDKRIDHLGKGPKAAVTDRIQRWIFRDNTFYAFIVKLFLAVFASANMLYNYNPYYS